MKKIIALIIAALMLVGLFAGCGKTDADEQKGTTPTGEGSGISETEEAGSLVVTANACVSITYGTDGLVLKAEGLNEDGVDLLESYDEVTGYSCTELITQVIKDSAARMNLGYLTYVAVKINKDAQTPGTNFMDSLESAAKKAVEEAAPNAKLIMIKQENLDADGNIDLATAKKLVEAYLEVEKVDGFDGTAKPVEGFYSFAVTYGEYEEAVRVNADTGAVGDGSLVETQEPEETDPTEETESPAEPTEESQPVVDEPIVEETSAATEAEEN